MRQWVLKITEYAERLLEDLEELDWPQSIKEMQRNWIGKSSGAEVTFRVAGSDEEFVVFTTRPDTLFGATYCVLAPEHELVLKIAAADRKEEVLKYIEYAKARSDLDRTDLNKDKTGVFTGAYAINPVNENRSRYGSPITCFPHTGRARLWPFRPRSARLRIREEVRPPNRKGVGRGYFRIRVRRRRAAR